MLVVNTVKVKYLHDYVLKISFSDRTVEEIDFKNFLSSAKNPMTKKYLDLKLFRKFSISNGDLHWNDYELSFPIWDLYQGKI